MSALRWSREVTVWCTRRHSSDSAKNCAFINSPSIMHSILPRVFKSPKVFYQAFWQPATKKAIWICNRSVQKKGKTSNAKQCSPKVLCQSQETRKMRLMHSRLEGNGEKSTDLTCLWSYLFHSRKEEDTEAGPGEASNILDKRHERHWGQNWKRDFA